MPPEPLVCPGNAPPPSLISLDEHPNSSSMCNQWRRNFFPFFTRLCTPLLSALCGETQTLLEGHHDELQPESTRPGTAQPAAVLLTHLLRCQSLSHTWKLPSAPGQTPCAFAGFIWICPFFSSATPGLVKHKQNGCSKI